LVKRANPILDDEILSLDVPQLAQTILELVDPEPRRLARTEKAHPVDLSCLLSFSENGRTSMRRIVMAPIGVPWRSNGVATMVL
jgi:hypothetical protein